MNTLLSAKVNLSSLSVVSTLSSKQAAPLTSTAAFGKPLTARLNKKRAGFHPQVTRPLIAPSSQLSKMDEGHSLGSAVLLSPTLSSRKRAASHTTTMQATGTSSKERTDSIVSTQEEAASRLGVGNADFLNDPDKERGRQPAPEGVHPSVQLLIDVLKEEMPKFFSSNGITTTMYREDVSACSWLVRAKDKTDNSL